jgi:hypothetical protein
MLTFGRLARDTRTPLSVTRCCVPAQPALPYGTKGTTLPAVSAVVLARPSPRCQLPAGTPARAPTHSVQRKLTDEAALPNAGVPCLLQCAALRATVRLSQTC